MDETSPTTESTRRNTDPFTLNNHYEAPAARNDVVSVERHAQHVLVTKDEAATLRFLVDFMGGKAFHESENTAANTRSTFVSIGEDRPATVEVAVPTGEGGAQRDLASNGSIYHRLDLKVHDFDGAMRHLERCGISTETRGDGFAVTDPQDCFGLRFGITAELTPGDPRL